MRRLAQASSADELVARTLDSDTLLDTHKPYLYQRWHEGCRDVAVLHADLQQRGYRGSSRTLLDALGLYAAARFYTIFPDRPGLALSNARVAIDAWMASTNDGDADRDGAYLRCATICMRDDRSWATDDEEPRRLTTLLLSALAADRRVSTSTAAAVLDLLILRSQWPVAPLSQKFGPMHPRLPHPRRLSPRPARTDGRGPSTSRSPTRGARPATGRTHPRRRAVAHLAHNVARRP